MQEAEAEGCSLSHFKRRQQQRGPGSAQPAISKQYAIFQGLNTVQYCAVLCSTALRVQTGQPASLPPPSFVKWRDVLAGREAPVGFGWLG